jgi:hypothetical protein
MQLERRRDRDNLVVASTQAVHHMQKALFEMNVQLSNVISDIVGETGLNILEAIVAGQKSPKQLAALCSSRIKASRETVAKSLHGNWDGALLFALKVALETYRFSQIKIQDCDCCIQRHLAQFESRAEVIKTWLLFAGDACTRDTPLNRLDLPFPNDPAHPDPASYQAERRALQLNYRNERQNDGHLYSAQARRPPYQPPACY